MRFIILITLLFSTTCYADMTVKVGRTFDIAPGASNDFDITKYDMGYTWEEDLSKRFDLTQEAYLAVFDSIETNGGVGYRIGLEYDIYREIELFLGAGLLYIHDGGSISGLAQSPIYGTIQGGIKYKWFMLGCDHVSSPLHGAEDGDSGLNTIFVKCSINF